MMQYVYPGDTVQVGTPCTTKITQTPSEPAMKILTANWMPNVNWLTMLCDCGEQFETRADRWRIVCPHCGRRSNMDDVRHEYLRLQGGNRKGGGA